MMEPPGGTALVEESIAEALDFRRAMRKVDEEWGADWWFKVWGPDYLVEEGMAAREDWVLRTEDPLARFRQTGRRLQHARPDQGHRHHAGTGCGRRLFRRVRYSRCHRHQYLAEHGVVVEKCGLYSFFIMFTIGITKALEHHGDRAAAVQGRLRQEPAAVARAAGVHRQTPALREIGLRDLCDQIHGIYKTNDVARLTTEMYLSDMVPAMKPSDAFAKMAHGEIERVRIDELEGRVTAVLLTPYPPGIPLLIPGERFNKTIVDYLRFARDFNKRFPGFETDIHGLVAGEVDGQRVYYVDCVK